MALVRHTLRSTFHTIKANAQHRSLIADLIRRDFKVRYLGSMLGSYWNFIHPLAMIAIYTVIFSRVFEVRLGGPMFDHPYAFTLYLCAGMFPWTAFNEMVNRGTVVFHEHASLVKKVRFPQEVLATIATGSNAITLCISLLIYCGLLVFSGHGLTWAVGLLPIVLLLQMIFACGLGMILGVLNVFFRDIQQFLPIIFQVWFWATPIVYTMERVPAQYRKLFLLNPFYIFTTLYQGILFTKNVPSWRYFAAATALAVVAYSLGAVMFQRFKHEIPDEL